MIEFIFPLISACFVLPPLFSNAIVLDTMLSVKDVLVLAQGNHAHRVYHSQVVAVVILCHLGLILSQILRGWALIRSVVVKIT